jgi:hypothetical protein
MDVNCDGVVDLCDASIVGCRFGSATADCCGDAVCGACEVFGGCQRASVDLCRSSGGTYLGDDIACDCACNADVNDDGVVTYTGDVLFIRACTDPDHGECSRADVDCDGDVDRCDVLRANCIVEGGDYTCCGTVGCGACIVGSDCVTTSPSDCASLSGEWSIANCPCTCDADIWVDGRIAVLDLIKVQSCRGRPKGAGCEHSDIDCDGAVTFCDVAKVACALHGGADCCATVPCGACTVLGECEPDTAENCAARGGSFAGAGTGC